MSAIESSQAPASAPAQTPASDNVSAPTAPSSAPAGQLEGVSTAVTADGREVQQFVGNMDVPWGEGPEARDSDFNPDFQRFGRDSQQSAVSSLSRSPTPKPAAPAAPPAAPKPEKKKKETAASTAGSDSEPKSGGCSLRSQIIGSCLVAGGIIMMCVALKFCANYGGEDADSGLLGGPAHHAAGTARSLRRV